MPDERHPTADELAGLALGVFEPSHADAVNAHVAGCAECQQLLSKVEGLPKLLASTWYPPIPESTSRRIGAALTVEAGRRARGVGGGSPASRRQGIKDIAAGLDLFDHLCCAYRGKADWADRAAEFSADGVVAGQYVALVGDASTEGLRSELAEQVNSMPASRATTGGAAEVHDLADFFQCRPDGIIDPDACVEANREALERALAAGYTGLRVVNDSTPAARTGAQRDAAARLEYLTDRKVSSHPVSRMCGYDVEELGPDTVAEVACMHPFCSPGAAPFRLYVEHDADLGLAGRVDDPIAEGLFRRALERTDPPAGSELVVDARPAEFISDRALAELDAHAARMGRTAVVHTSTSNSPSPASVASLTSLTVDIG
jgi:hypothetical protein